MPKTLRTRRRYPALLGLLLVIALAASACTFEVQPIESYTSQDGYMSLTIPLSWGVLEEDSSDGTTTVFVGSDETLSAQDAIPSGVAGVGVMFMPNFFVQPGAGEFTLSTAEMLDFMRTGALQEQAGEVSDVQQVTLENGEDAYMFTVANPDGDIAAYAYTPAEGLLAIAFVMTASGEENTALLDEAQDVLHSIRFTGDPVEFTDRAREIMGAE